MKRRIPIILMLAALLCVCCLTFTSCLDLLNSGVYAADNGGNTGKSGDAVTKDELDKILKNYVDLGSATVYGGDTYEISVTNSGDSILSASHALLSAVSIQCVFTKNVRNYWGSPGSKNMTQEYYAAGAGVIIDLDKTTGSAYVLTNYHVVSDASSTTEGHVSNRITLYLYGQEYTDYAIPATYVGGSMNYDLAVLKVENSTVLAKSSAVAATFADSNGVSVLETAIAIGNPEAEGISVTVGHINVDSETIDLTASDNVSTIELRVMRIDAAVNGGNSGGGLFNEAGELIGIVNAKMSSSDVDNIGYAIPSNVAKAIAKNIIDYCEGDNKEDRIAYNTVEGETWEESVEQRGAYRCLLGITVSAAQMYTEYDPETCKVHKREKVAVASVTKDGSADGKLEVGDIITSLTIDGVDYEVSRVFHVVDSMLNARIGSNVVFHVLRGEEEIDVTVDITAKALINADRVND